MYQTLCFAILVEGGEKKSLPSQTISAEPSNFTEENEGSEVRKKPACVVNNWIG